MSLAYEKIIEKISLAIVLALTAKAQEKLPEYIKKLIDWWNGKSIAIIGPTASGKNSLFLKLQDQTAPEVHIQTRGTETIKTFNVNWPMPNKQAIKFRCKGSINVGGELDERDRYWVESCKGADVIFYIVDIIKLTESTDDTLARIKSDLKWLATNLRHFKSSSSIHILVNKVDSLVKGLEPEDVVRVIKEKIGAHIERLQNLIDAILQSNESRISGMSPISMTDDHLFGLLFTEILKEVNAAQVKET